MDVLTAFEDGSQELEDPDLLDRATSLERVLFSQDDDLLKEGVKRQREGDLFYGVVYAHQLKVPISQCIEDLALIAQAGEPQELLNQIIFLPL